MDFGSFKHWAIVCVVAAAGMSFAAYKMMARPSHHLLGPEDISYEMPRPKTTAAPYDLSGRQVVRNIHSLQNPALAAKPAPTPADLAAQQARLQQETNARVAAQKQRIAQQRELDNRRKQAEARKKALAAKEEARKKAELQARINQEAEVQKQKSGLTSDPNSKNTPPVAAAPAAQDPAPVAAGGGDATANADDAKLSPGQWASKIRSQPTTKNATDFAQAYLRGEVDAKTYFDVAQGFLADHSEQNQKIGVLLFTLTPSVMTFSKLVANASKDSLPETVRTQLQTVLKSYAEPARFSILSKAMISNDPATSQTALSLLKTVVAAQTALKEQSAAIAGRDARAPGSTSSVTVTQLQSFITNLQALVKSTDAATAQQAQALIDSIKALKPA